MQDFTIFLFLRYRFWYFGWVQWQFGHSDRMSKKAEIFCLFKKIATHCREYLITIQEDNSLDKHFLAYQSNIFWLFLCFFIHRISATVRKWSWLFSLLFLQFQILDHSLRSCEKKPFKTIVRWKHAFLFTLTSLISYRKDCTVEENFKKLLNNFFYLWILAKFEQHTKKIRGPAGGEEGSNNILKITFIFSLSAKFMFIKERFWFFFLLDICTQKFRYQDYKSIKCDLFVW